MVRDRRKGDRSKAIASKKDQARADSLSEKDRKLNSLLELGQLIGLDLEINDMLLQIAQKACELVEADRCSLFLHDPNADELWSTAALGMGKEVIRIPSGSGVAGYCFQTGETLNIEDAYTDPRFNKEVDAQTGYRTQSILCMPLYKRDGQRLGVIQLLNKKSGRFDDEDAIFLRNFGNHASVFIEMAQLRKARIDSIENSKRELERLNQAKSRALDHLSHELMTPLALIQGNIRLLKRKTQTQTPPIVREEVFESLERNLTRLSDIQQETDRIIGSYQELEARQRSAESDRSQPLGLERIDLYPFAERILEDVKTRAKHRDLELHLDGQEDLNILMDSKILEESLVGLLKNAVENTPDEGMIRVVLEEKGQRVLLKVQDFGIGITKENQRHLFDGLFHTLDTDLYSSKKPYDFGAGGKGLDLLQIKTYGQRFGFDISVGSQRCLYLPTDRDLCPGRISACPHCKKPEDCLASGGSTFCVSLPTVREGHPEKI